MLILNLLKDSKKFSEERKMSISFYYLTDSIYSYMVLNPSVCFISTVWKYAKKNRMIPSCWELAANIFLTNDYVDIWAHKLVNQTLPLQTNRVHS